MSIETILLSVLYVLCGAGTLYVVLGMVRDHYLATGNTTEITLAEAFAAILMWPLIWLILLVSCVQGRMRR